MKAVRLPLPAGEVHKQEPILSELVAVGVPAGVVGELNGQSNTCLEGIPF